MLRLLRELIGTAVCSAVGHHPDDYRAYPLGPNVDGDFVLMEHLHCRRCDADAEQYTIYPPVPVYTTDDL